MILKARCSASDLRVMSLAVLVAACSLAATPRLLTADDKVEARLREGWKRLVRIPETVREELVSLTTGDGEIRKLTFRRAIPESRVVSWVEQGWLCVRRTTAEHELEWQVVLARARDPEPPTVTIDEMQSSLELTYGDYFIREDDMGKLRIEREPKSADSPEWPQIKFEPFEFQRVHAELGFSEVFGSDFWTWLQARTTPGRPDLWLRLTEGTGMQENDGFGINSISYAGSADVVYDLRIRARIEPGLLIAARRTVGAAEQGLTGETLQHRLGAARAPALSASRWLNAERPIALDDPKSRLTLIGFWAGWSESSIIKLRRMKALHREFGERGLKVIGAHSALDADDAARIVRTKEVTFPVMIDDSSEHPKRFGVTAERYRVYDLPAFFLIDGSGSVLTGYGMGPPPREMIEALLRDSQE